MLAAHKQRGADATIAVLNVSLKEASRFVMMSLMKMELFMNSKKNQNIQMNSCIYGYLYLYL